LPLRLTPRRRSTANTAAASVEETMAPTRRPVRSSKPNTSQANKPTRPAVKTTPTVERRIPRLMTGRMTRQFVSSPPENSMKASAMVPTRLAACVLVNWMPPGPSDPASMPMQRNTISVGTPARSETRLAKMLARTRNPITRRIKAGSIIRGAFSVDSPLAA